MTGTLGHFKVVGRKLRCFIFTVTALSVFLATTHADEVVLLNDVGGTRRQIKETVDRAHLISQANDNKTYQLDLRREKQFELQGENVILTVGKKEIPCGHHPIQNGRVASLYAHIDDISLLPAIKEHFNAVVEDRRHPGHRMLATFVPIKQPFALGDRILATLHIKNIGDSDFSFIAGGRSRGTRDNQFAFSAEERRGAMLPDIGDPHHYGGPLTPVTLKPNDEYSLSVDISKWFDFKAPGSYLVRGSYYMKFLQPGDSNLRTIWEDFACAEFWVAVGDR